MRNDRLSSLHQRLKRGSFEFGALLDGVSTLDEPEAPADETPPAAEPPVESTATPAEAEITPARDAAPEPTPEPTPEPSPDLAQEPADLPAFAAPLAEAPAPVTIIDLPEEPAPAAASLAAHTPESPPMAAALPVQLAPTESERLGAAMSHLGGRLAREAGSLRAALQNEDAEEAGFHLAHVNSVLELLRDIDPSGDLARELSTPYAPPVGRAWPGAAWTVAEFAHSPFSGLLPPRADDKFTRDLLYAAWGVAIEHVPSA
jgi:hypothetical protein